MGELLDLIKSDVLPGYDPFRDAGDCHFDEEVAERAISFFPDYLTHKIGPLAGQPYYLEPHEKAIVANLFGWKRPDGYRRYREALLYVPKKNSKTTLGAGIAVLVLSFDKEASKEIYCASGDEEQARYLFSLAKHFINGDEELAQRASVQKNSITFDGDEHYFKVLTSKAGTKHGPNIHCLLIDELHIVSDDLVHTLYLGTAARAQPLTLYMTTAPVIGEDICNDTYEKAKNVIKGSDRDSAFLPAVFEANEDDDFREEKTWFKANPNLGKSIPLEYFRREADAAARNARKQNEFKRLHLNLRTEQTNRWLDLFSWDACQTELRTLPAEWREEQMERLKGKPCHGGFDVGQTDDITDLELLFEELDGSITTLGFRWIPSDGRWRQGSNLSQYLTWIDQGFIKLVPGEVIDYDVVLADMEQIFSDYPLLLINADSQFQGAHLCTKLREEVGIEVQRFPQTWEHLTEPCKELERLILSRQINHGNDPVLRWYVGNVATKESPDGKRFKPVKPSRNLKIDGVVAMIMAIAGQITGDHHQGSVYDSEEMVI